MRQHSRHAVRILLLMAVAAVVALQMLYAPSGALASPYASALPYESSPLTPASCTNTGCNIHGVCTGFQANHNCTQIDQNTCQVTACH